MTNGHRRWRIAFLLAIGVLINYIDRVNLSVSHDALQSRFLISDVTFGWLLSSYNFTYAICQLPMGVLLDRFGVRRIGRLSAFVVSVASLAASVAQGMPSFFAARFLLGVGEAPLFPSNAKAIGHWFPRHERSFATSLFDSAAKFASAIGVPMVGILLLHFGWRWSFAATGLLTLGYFGAFTLIYREPEDDPHLSAQELVHISSNQTRAESHREFGSERSLGQLLGEPKVIGLAIGMVAYNYSFYLMLAWLPTYLSRSLKIDLLHSFLFSGIPWLVAAVVDLVVGGWAVDWFAARSLQPGKVRLVFLIVGMAAGIGILGAGYAHTPGAVLFWLSFSMSGLAVVAPVNWSAPSLIASRDNVATVSGIMNFSGQLAAIAAPIATGYLVMATHSFFTAFVAAALVLMTGVIAYVILLRSVEPMEPHRM
jgi:MFS transporter, ACS family, D-galactonate transporter